VYIQCDSARNMLCSASAIALHRSLIKFEQISKHCWHFVHS